PAAPAALDRFLVEVRALARLNHPNIVRVLAVDTYRADPYFTMEYAAGGSLAERGAQSGPLSPHAAAPLLTALPPAAPTAPHTHPPTLHHTPPPTPATHLLTVSK